MWCREQYQGGRRGLGPEDCSQEVLKLLPPQPAHLFHGWASLQRGDSVRDTWFHHKMPPLPLPMLTQRVGMSCNGASSIVECPCCLSPCSCEERQRNVQWSKTVCFIQKCPPFLPHHLSMERQRNVSHWSKELIPVFLASANVERTSGDMIFANSPPQVAA